MGGNDSNSGLEPLKALKDYKSIKLSPGDTVLFKRGSMFRNGLDTSSGSEEGDITYGAYGEGEKPVFSGSVPIGGADAWVEEAPNVWRYKRAFPSEVCNLVFNEGETCGNMRWKLADIKVQGEWYFSSIGVSAQADQKHQIPKCEDGILYLYSSANPGLLYTSIESVLWGNRRLVSGERYITLKNLTFQNSGVHGFQQIIADHITIRDCDFRFIGGAVWSRELKIRFGNAVEFWDGARDILVENCTFNNIYDSGVTHQGSIPSGPYERIYFRNNTFTACGMAAYECRGPAPAEVYFENNTCIDTGGGFSMQGETSPRRSEIYPQPMGHHVFIWLIDKGTQKGHVHICNNTFKEAPYGAAIYSIIDPEDERQFLIDYNSYKQTTGDLLIRMNDRLYGRDEFEQYRAETGNDLYGSML
jgi:predicted outer membrane repeat protein